MTNSLHDLVVLSDSVSLYMGDCRDILPTLGKVDAVVTDPPYGVDLDYNSYDDTFDNWKALVDEVIPVLCRMSKGPVIIPTSKFEAEQHLHKLGPIWRMCWFKGASCTRSPIGFKDWEPTFVFNKAPRKQVHDYFTAHANMVRDQVPDHPCPKPIAWASWLVDKMSEEGETVCDPFMGSGTTGIACHRTGRKFIGIEKDARYFEIARKRLENELRQGLLPLTHNNSITETGETP